MTEPLAKSNERQVFYDGLVLNVKDIVHFDDEYGLEQPGFRITDENDNYAWAVEGYSLGYSEDDGELLVEPDVLELKYVNSKTPGRGKSLLGATFEEAARRGFTLARLEIINPKIVSRLESLRAEGHIEAARFFADYRRPEPGLSISALLASQPEIDPLMAEGFLTYFESSLDRGEDVSGSGIDCVVALKL